MIGAITLPQASGAHALRTPRIIRTTTSCSARRAFLYITFGLKANHPGGFIFNLLVFF